MGLSYQLSKTLPSDLLVSIDKQLSLHPKDSHNSCFPLLFAHKQQHKVKHHSLVPDLGFNPSSTLNI